MQAQIDRHDGALDVALVRRLARAIARKGRLAPDEVDDFESVCWVHILADGQRVLRQCKDHLALPGYLRTVFRRLLLDEYVSRWGKWRPTTKATRLGPPFVLLERLVEREGLSLEAASVRTGLTESQAAAHLQCCNRRLRPRFTCLDDATIDSGSGSHADDPWERREQQHSRQRRSRNLNLAIRDLHTQDRWFIEHYYVRQTTIPEIANTLGLTPKAAYRRLDGIRRQLRERLNEGGRLTGHLPSSALHADGGQLQ